MSTILNKPQRPPPMTTAPRPANKILANLPHEEFERLRPKLREVTFPIGEILYMPEQKIEHAYFVNRGIVSLLAALEDGATVEAGVIGPEGIAGVAVILGAKSTPNQALTQSDVQAMQISAGDLVAEFNNGGKLRDLMLRFVHTMFTQVTQTAACNRLHTLDQRLARWLLITHDRLKQDQFTLTQEFLSRMLGVRRAGVSVAANDFRQAGLIDYRRGDIVVVDRKGLEAATCECYRIVKHEYDSYLQD
jgi:CRP-like cAMP-binding protein